ncbi:MAG TPA: nuclear transport factor 2 family protein [Burkholderiales bacterium]|nr:nuclear transport factor 2 family protein [Burkholderiales bacterium]
MKPPAFPTSEEAETAFYEAFERADLEAMMAVWAEDEDIVCVHPTGPRLLGLEQVRESWRQIFSGGPSLRFRLSDQQVLRGMLLSIHSLYEHVTLSGEAQPRNPIVATNIYVLTDRGWRMLAHHASPAPGDRGSVREGGPRVLH